MTSFKEVPYSDIKDLLITNKQEVPVNEDEAYSKAWNLIKNNPGINVSSLFIADFIIAYNLSLQGIQANSYKTSSILLARDADLQLLSNALHLPSVDKERIIRILGYLGLLDNDTDIFDTLPLEVLERVISELDCKSIKLICQI